VTEREVRYIAFHIKAARFPAYKDLAGFDFAASEVNEALIRQLHRGDFIDGADNNFRLSPSCWGIFRTRAPIETDL
jgi:hypothetical protein